MTTLSPGRGLLIAASVVIVATLVAVIALTPSPTEHRQVQRDAAVLRDLDQLEGAIKRWHRENGQLPPDLVPVVALPGLDLSLAPSDGAPAYDYLPLDTQRFQLCAHFLTDTADSRYGRQYPGERAHGAGRHCFTHRVGTAAAATAQTTPEQP